MAVNLELRRNVCWRVVWVWKVLHHYCYRLEQNISQIMSSGR